jgi:hypothetical protein
MAIFYKYCAAPSHGKHRRKAVVRLAWSTPEQTADFGLCFEHFFAWVKSREPDKHMEALA